ncbi:MAG: ParB/RepB/Spo0J family partition protein [Nitrosotalea sp.]
MLDIIDSSLVEQIELRMIRPSRFAVRNRFNERDAEDRCLMQSIRVHGLLQPIVVRPFANGFEIVAGHRRFQACRILRWRFIPCKICEMSDMHAFEIQLSENVQRKSMNPLEEAEAFRKYVMDFGWGGISDLAHRIAKSEEYVSHRIQLLSLPDNVKKQIISSQIKLSQAMELTSLSIEKQREVVDQIVDKNLTVKQIRKIKSEIRDKNEKTITQSSIDESYSVRMIKKTSLTLKIALTRIDSLIDDIDRRGNTKQKEDFIVFLMGLRLKIHSMIDESIHFRNEKLVEI